jgi:hypothetical protein
MRDAALLNGARTRDLLAHMVLEFVDGHTDCCNEARSSRAFREIAKVRLAKVVNAFEHLILLDPIRFHLEELPFYSSTPEELGTQIFLDDA